jgi:hypothetical protein
MDTQLMRQHVQNKAQSKADNGSPEAELEHRKKGTV